MIHPIPVAYHAASKIKSGESACCRTISASKWDRAGFLNSEPPPELVAEQFALRREVVESIAERIEVAANKTVSVLLVFDLTPDELGDNLANAMPREFIGGSSLKDFKLWEAR